MPTKGFSETGHVEELLRQAADVVVELRPDGRLIYLSDSVDRVLGRAAESLVGLSFLEIIIPEDRETALAAFRKMVETGDESLSHFRVAHQNGHRVEFEATSRCFVDSLARHRIVVVCRDVTERSTRAAADRERDSYHRAIAQSGARPAAIAGTDGKVYFSNRRFREVFGSDIALSNIQERATKESRTVVDSAWRLATQGRNVHSGAGDFEYNHEDGTTSWFAATWEPIQTHDQRSLFAVFYEDITQRKKIEHALRTIASGSSFVETESLRPMIAMLAEALEMDRLVLGLLDDDSDQLRILAAWQDGEFLAETEIAITGLPDHVVSQGEACIHPTGVCQLMPAVAEQVGHDFVSYAGFPLRRVDGRVIGIIGSYGRKAIRDADLMRSLLSSFATHVGTSIDRQRLDAEIRANQDRFDALALQSNDMLVEVDAEGRITYISQACLTLLGFDPEDIVGLRVEDLTHPDDLPLAQEPNEQTSIGSKQWVTVSRGRHADGSWRWFESKVSLFKASDDSPRALILARDITQRRRGELGRDLLYRVVQRGADLVFVCEPNTTLLFANEAATRLIGSPTSNAEETRTFSELLTEEDAERLRSEILPAVSPATPWSGELELIGSSNDTQPTPTEATIFLFQGTRESEATYLAITLRDLTKRRTAEEALRQSELRLSQAQKMEAVGRLSGGIAHDFNNLLTAIIGYADLVLGEIGESHGARADTEEIMRAAERAGGLTRQLLAFSRRQVLQPEPVDLNAVVADIDRMMRRLIGENIELVTHQAGELQPIIADPGQVEQVIVNLVVNARDAMPQGGRIVIETTQTTIPDAVQMASGLLEAGQYVVLRVSDTGTGMSEEIRAQIFEPFFTTKEAYQGTGLGLASAYGIVSLSGGQIDVESALDRGTTFSVYLPAAREGTLESHPADPNRFRRGNETILLVEDSDPVRHLLQKTLEQSGYRVLAAESGTAALRYCSRHTDEIDLLLADVVLPKISGPEVARRAIELRPGIRVLFMSGFTDATLTRHGLQPGTSSLLEKPFSPAEVLARIRSLLDADATALKDPLAAVES